MLRHTLLAWLVLLCGIAWGWPRWFAGLPDPFLATQAAELLPWMIAATMFAIGGLLPRDELANVARRWPAVLFGTAMQYTAMPLGAYFWGHALGLSGGLLAGVILVGCVPGAMASNVLTLVARGNVSYSVSLTTVATLISPLTVPAALYLLIDGAQIDKGAFAVGAFKILVTQVVGPVLAGYAVSRLSPVAGRVLQRIGPAIANVTILWVIAVVVALRRDELSQISATLLWVLAAVNLTGYAAGFLAATAVRLTDPMRRALTLEIGMQNAGLGTVMALQLFGKETLASIPTAAYTFGCMLTGTMLAQAWALRAVHGEAVTPEAGS